MLDKNKELVSLGNKILKNSGNNTHRVYQTPKYHLLRIHENQCNRDYSLRSHVDGTIYTNKGAEKELRNLLGQVKKDTNTFPNTSKEDTERILKLMNINEKEGD